MAKEEYKKALQSAQTELEKLLKQRSKIDSRIAGLQKSVQGLSALCDETDHSKSPAMEEIFSDFFHFGTTSTAPRSMTESIRKILEKSFFPVSPPQIKEALSVAGFKMDEYANALSPIHNTLKRLSKQGEVERMPTGWVITDKGRGKRRLVLPDFVVPKK